MASISVDVSIDEFGDDEILEAAIFVLKHLCGDANNPGMKKRLAELRVVLAKLEGPDEVEPSSQAAKLKDAAELKRFVESHPDLYHFAGDAS